MKKLVKRMIGEALMQAEESSWRKGMTPRGWEGEEGPARVRGNGRQGMYHMCCTKNIKM